MGDKGEKKMGNNDNQVLRNDRNKDRDSRMRGECEGGRSAGFGGRRERVGREGGRRWTE